MINRSSTLREGIDLDDERGDQRRQQLPLCGLEEHAQVDDVRRYREHLDDEHTSLKTCG